MRELIILRKLTEIDANGIKCIVKLIDVILPSNVPHYDDLESTKTEQLCVDEKSDVGFHKFDHIFIVMELVESDLH